MTHAPFQDSPAGADAFALEDSRAVHGGGVDAAAARWGGARKDWLDLSTGINPHGYPVPDFSPEVWRDLPDRRAEAQLIEAARTFWDVPVGVDVLPAPGVSVLIAAIPGLAPRDTVRIAAPTYGEHAEAFRAAGWRVVTEGPARAQVAVHPNNPDGRLWSREGLLDTHRGLTVIDESFCDCDPGQSLADLAARPGVVVLKGLGKFWGLGGLRLGFALGRRATLDRLRARIGPWAVSGPALALGAQALGDRAWAADAQARLSKESALLDTKLTEFGARLVGGTKLFRTYAHDDAPALADRLARCHILVRVFTYNRRWLRFGLPGHETDWARLAQGLEA